SPSMISCAAHAAETRTRSPQPESLEPAPMSNIDVLDIAPSAEALAALANKLRRLSIRATSEAGTGHPTTCMSCAEIMSVLFFDEMRFDPKDPGARNVDAFVLSKGHAAPILW